MIDVDEVRARLAVLGQPAGPAAVAEALRWLGHVVSDTAVLTTVEALRRDSTGAGILDPLLREPGVTDVLVNGPHQVFVDRGHGLERAAVTFVSDEQVRRLAVRLAGMVGRRLDDGQPFVDARLPDGTRVHAVLSSVADPGTCLSLRVPRAARLSLDQWREAGSLAPLAHDVLTGLVRQKAAFLVTGVRAVARPRCSERCSVRPTRPNGWSSWRTPGSCPPDTRTACASRPGRPTPRGPAPSR